MPLFGKSKKTAPPHPQQQQQQPQQQNPSLIYTSQVNLPGPYGNVPPPSSGYLGLRPNTAPGYQPPPGWAPAVQYQPVHVTQNYYLAPPLPLRPKKSFAALDKLKLGSSNKLEVPPCVPGAKILNDGLNVWYQQGTQYLSSDQGPCLYDQICAKFDTIVTQIDSERFSGDERELAVPQPMWQQQQDQGYNSQEVAQGKSKGMVNNSVSTALTSTNYFAKVNLYVNSRLPPDLPPMKL